MGFVMVSDIVEENGLTVRQNNLNKEHSIALGTLVEIVCEDYGDEDDKNGLRLYVVGHSRDCDGTPLYNMSFNKNAEEEYKRYEQEIQFLSGQERFLCQLLFEQVKGSIIRHYSIDSLKIV